MQLYLCPRVCIFPTRHNHPIERALSIYLQIYDITYVQSTTKHYYHIFSEYKIRQVGIVRTYLSRPSKEGPRTKQTKFLRKRNWCKHSPNHKTMTKIQKLKYLCLEFVYLTALQNSQRKPLTFVHNSLCQFCRNSHIFRSKNINAKQTVFQR